MKKQIVIKLEKSESGWTGSMRGKTDKGYTSPVFTSGSFNKPDGAIINLGCKTETIEQWMEQIQ